MYFAVEPFPLSPKYECLHTVSDRAQSDLRNHWWNNGGCPRGIPRSWTEAAGIHWHDEIIDHESGAQLWLLLAVQFIETIAIDALRLPYFSRCQLLNQRSMNMTIQCVRTEDKRFESSSRLNEDLVGRVDDFMWKANADLEAAQILDIINLKFENFDALECRPWLKILNMLINFIVMKQLSEIDMFLFIVQLLRQKPRHHHPVWNRQYLLRQRPSRHHDHSIESNDEQLTLFCVIPTSKTMPAFSSKNNDTFTKNEKDLWFQNLGKR